MNGDNNKSIVVDAGLIKLLGRKLYNSSTGFIVLRELIQNAVDSYGNKTGLVDVAINHLYTSSNFITGCTVTDKGCGMSEKVLTDVFLSIGSSLKTGSNSIGGFGIAKVSIFACDNWRVHTTSGVIDQSLVFNGGLHRKAGTSVSVSYEKEYYGARHFAAIYANSHDKVRIRINHGSNIDDSRIVPRYSGKLLDIVSLNGITARISIAKSLGVLSGYVIYRINGLVQFLDYVSIEGANVLVDFDSIGFKAIDDNYPFTMSREGINQDWRDKIRIVLDKIEADKQSSKRVLEREGKTRKSANIGGFDVEYSGSKLGVLDLHSKRVLCLSRDILDALGYNHIQVGLLAGDKIDELAHYADGIIRIKAANIKHDTVGGYVFGLFGLLCHELTHISFTEHNEDFTIQHVELMRKGGDKLNDKYNILVKKYRILAK